MAVFFKIGLISLVTATTSPSFPPKRENIDDDVCDLFPMPVIFTLTFPELADDDSLDSSSSSMVSLEFIASLLKIVDFSLAASLSEYTRISRKMFLQTIIPKRILKSI